MDRESRELRTYSQSWPPGFFVGSVAIDAGARARRRDGLMLIALAACGWCLGYAITDWVCDANQRKLAAASAQQAELEVVALHRSRSEADRVAGQSRPLPSQAASPALAAPARLADAAVGLEAARTSEAAVASKAAVALETVALAEVAVVEPSDRTASAASIERALPLPAASRVPKGARVAASSRKCCKLAARKLADNEEPSPVVSPEELNKALTLAAASKKIFASVDEGPQSAAELIALPPSAAEPAALVDDRVVAIEALSVEGGVPSRVVSRGVQRLLPHYDRCREFCDTEPQRMKLSTTIDEAGHGRQVTVEGLSRPGLRRCLEQATAHLVVPAPDTGTARARWIVRFASR